MTNQAEYLPLDYPFRTALWIYLRRLLVLVSVAIISSLLFCLIFFLTRSVIGPALFCAAYLLLGLMGCSLVLATKASSAIDRRLTTESVLAFEVVIGHELATLLMCLASGPIGLCAVAVSLIITKLRGVSSGSARRERLVRITWSAQATAAPEAREQAADVLRHLICRLEDVGVADSVSRVELYRPNGDGEIPCLVLLKSNPHFGGSGEELPNLEDIHMVQRELWRQFRPLPWRFATMIEDAELLAEVRVRILGRDPELQALASR